MIGGATPSRPATWTAIVPVKPPESRKTRLSGLLAADRRAYLGEMLLDHVLGVLEGVADLDVMLLAERCPERWHGAWIADRRRGLNAELDAAARGVPGRLLVIHADLPALGGGDVAALLDAAARDGMAIAPDRHRTGTNALALADVRRLDFAFGPGSFGAHVRAAPKAAIVERPGLALDLDTPDDLAAMLAGAALDPAMRDALAAIRGVATV